MNYDRGQPELTGFALPIPAESDVPTPRTVKALRELLGLAKHDAARLAKVSHHALKAYEGYTDATLFPQASWRDVPAALNIAYASKGARWCEPDLHAGANLVYLKHGSASYRRAIKAAIALMGHYEGYPRDRVTLAHLVRRVVCRVQGIDRSEAMTALGGRIGLPPQLADECLRELEEAGCYFTPSPDGGWRGVGCNVSGCDW